MTAKSILAIGAGISGLSFGCQAQMNGFKTTILEMNSNPGGYCTAWKRGSYEIDNCVHWVQGTNPNYQFSNIWKELGVIGKLNFIDKGLFSVTHDELGNIVRYWTDLSMLQEELTKVSKEDHNAIKEMIADIKNFQNAMRFGQNIGKWETFTKIRRIPKLFKKYNLTSKEWAIKNLKNKNLIKSFSWCFGFENYPMAFQMQTFAHLADKNALQPLGGSNAITKAIVDRQKHLGGELKLSSKVVKILVKNGKAIGVKLSTGEELYANQIVTACDAQTTLQKFLEGKYINRQIKEFFKNPNCARPWFVVNLGVKTKYKDFQTTIGPHAFQKSKEFDFEGKRLNICKVMVRNGEHFAPVGKSLITCFLDSDYSFWSKFKENNILYNEEKRKHSEILINQIEEFFPNLRNNIEVIDAQTPLTNERYTGNFKGVWMTFFPKSLKELLHQYLQIPGKSLIPPKVANLQGTGMWFGPPGGLPSGAISGRMTALKICLASKRKFVTHIPQ